MLATERMFPIEELSQRFADIRKIEEEVRRTDMSVARLSEVYTQYGILLHDIESTTHVGLMTDVRRNHRNVLQDIILLTSDDRH